MKRILSFTLVLTMLFGMVSVTAVSANDEVKIDNANPLIASMKFDNNLKDDANQEILTANGNHSFVDGVLPGTKALHLESGDDNYVGTKDSLKFGSDSFTTSFWYKGDTKNDQVILSNKDFTKSSNEGWAIYTSGNSVNMNLGFPTTSVKFGRDTFNASDWRYVTFVVDRDKMLGSLYIDGYKMTETSLGVGTLDTPNPLNIGSDGLGKNGGNSFDIADLNVWKGALSSDMVQANYNSYGVNKVDMKALNDTIAEANTIVAGGLGSGFSETDFESLKKVLNTATAVATTQKVKLYTQETINYYKRELNNALFIYQKSNKTLTPAGLNMIIDSDPEISADPAKIAQIEKGYRTELRLFPQADVLFIPGDVTGGNNANEYVWMKNLTDIHTKLTNEGLLKNTKFYMVRGNHDMGGAEQFIPVGSAGAWNESTNSYDNNFFNDSYRVKVKGYNFVGFDGNYNNANTVGKATNFLNQIKNEADYDPTKPIFVSSHYPISGTVWGSFQSSAASNNVGKYIADNNFSQVVYMSGHTQYDPTDERSHYQSAATYLDSGASSYSSEHGSGPYGGYIEGSPVAKYDTTPRIVNFVEVYGSKMIIKQYNLATDEYVGIPSVKIVGEGKDAFTYGRSDIRELIAPQFDEGIKIDSFNNNELAFTIKQANDNVRIMEYNIELINKHTGKVEKSFNSLSLPLDKPFDEYRQYKFTDVSLNNPYMIRVFADDSMYNRSSMDIDLMTNSGNLNSITAPADITEAAIGSAKTADALGLPETVSLDTDEGRGYAIVTWNVDASNYDPTVKTVQTFTVNGTVTLPTGVKNPNNVPLTTSIRVTVNKLPLIGMTATQSSTSSGGVADRAVDGNTNGEYYANSVTHTLDDQGAWWMVDLGGNYNVGNINIFNRTDCCGNRLSDYNVLLLDQNQTVVWSNHQTTQPNPSTTVNVGGAVGRYVKIQLTGKDFLSLAEVEVYAPVTLTSITEPAAIQGLANGTEKTAAALGLPSTVELVTDGGSKNANVTWNVDAANYDPSLKIEQAFTVNGTVTLPVGVTNPNNVTLTTSISVTVLSAPTMPQSTLTGLQQVSPGQTFNLTMGLTSVTESVYQRIYAQDLTLHYNPADLQFDSVTSLKDGFQVIDQEETAPGQIRIIASNVEANQGVLAEGDLLTFNFTAKSAIETTAITVDNVVIANAKGNELQVGGASHEIQISKPVDRSLLTALIASAQAKYDAAVEGNGHGQYVNGSKAPLQSAITLAKATANDPKATQQQVDSEKAALEAAIQVFDTKKINADVNGDGSISIGDLAIVAATYGKQSGQAGWNEKADVNKDGKVDVVDLAIAAKAILQ